MKTLSYFLSLKYLKYLFCSVVLLTLSTNSQGHNPILPKPQEVNYGEEQFVIKEGIIGFAFRPSSEDKFAAKELGEVFSKVISSDIPVQESQAGATIIFERTGNNDPLPGLGEKAGSDSRESYRIKINSNNIRITAKSSAGLYYAVQTLSQMIENTGGNAIIPEADIEDWSSLAYRGFMMDMSHLHFPKIEEIKNQIDFLARWKINQYYFYSEASIELNGYPLLMADARFTKGQVKEIIKYAQSKHIDVIPIIELYGHMHDLFKLEHYSDLSIIKYARDFSSDDSRVNLLLEDWVTQISQLFQSPFFHIGFDEAEHMEIEARKLNKSPEEIYLDMLGRVTDLVKRQGKTPLFFPDILERKYPSIISEVSKDAIATPWHYAPLDEGDYDKFLSPYTKSNIPIILMGAIRNYRWVVPSFEVSSLNTDLLIKIGKRYNAIGFILTGWTDDPLNLMRMGRPDMVYAAAASWQNNPVERGDFFKNYSQIIYPPDVAPLIEKALVSIFQSESLIRNALGPTDIAIWANPFTVRSQKKIEANMDILRDGRLAAEAAQVYIREAMEYGIDSVSLTALLAGAKMLDYVGMKYLYAGQIASFWKNMDENPSSDFFYKFIKRHTNNWLHSLTFDMMDAISIVKGIFQEAWLNEYTPFRLEMALAKYEAELQFWLRFKRSIDDLGYQEDKALPSLESLSSKE